MPSNILGTDGADFASSTAGSSTMSSLVPRRLLPEVINAVRKKLVLRGLAARVFGPGAIPGRTLVVPMQSELTANNSMRVSQVSEAGEIPLTQSAFENLTFTPVKYGARVAVTRELQEDAMLDVAAYHAELAGYEFADNTESLIVSALDTASSGASHDVANSNATLTLTDITEAMQNLEADNYEPTHMVIGVAVANDIRLIDSFNEADKTGTTSAVTHRLIGTIYGMKVIVSNNVSSVLAYVIDARHAFAIAEKRPITIERYSDYARDTGYVVVTQRIAVNAWRNNAVSEITTT